MPRFSRRKIALVLVVFGAVSGVSAQEISNPLSDFRDTSAWVAADGVITAREGVPREPLATRNSLADLVVSLEYRAPANVTATVYLQGRYAVELPGAGAGAGDWRKATLRYRAPRFDAGFKKSENALLLEARVGDAVTRNRIFDAASPGAPSHWEEARGPFILQAREGSFALRNLRIQSAEFSAVTLPKASGLDTNEGELVDFVALGKETFESVGCGACHLVARDNAGTSTGPNLFGLLRREPRARDVVEGAAANRFSVKATRAYLHRSVRTPAEQLAVAEQGAKRGEAFLPLMPAFGKELLSDAQIDAIADYLATLNDAWDQGPAVKLQVKAGAPAYDPMTDGLQWLVDDQVRLQRGPMPGVSGRGIHVGNPNGVNYSFDPRLLAIVKIWQGGFLDMSGELTNRGGRGLAPGFDSREISFGDREYLLAPLDAKGALIDFSFKEAKFGDLATTRESLNSTQDHLARLAAIDAVFQGYERKSKNKLAAPVFRYRVGQNVIDITTEFTAAGEVTFTVLANLKTAQSFALNPAVLRNARAGSGKVVGDRWTIQPGKKLFTLRGAVTLLPGAWRPAPSNYKHGDEPVSVVPASAKLPAGYAIESWYPPKDNYGRPQLFEALGLARAKDGSIVVATRTAGIWRIVKGQWRLFAEGLFDSLGVVLEEDRGLTVVAGQKAELTRISDTDGDGVADRYETLFDAHSYHGNYHTYMHGPVRGADGNYYLALNLAHDGNSTTYNAGGAYMGTWGGFSGWAFRVEPKGRYTPIASGLRSPASLGLAPDGRLFYADNQGEYVGTSKLFVLEPGKFYGHPAGLVDLPGMTPGSPEISWERVAPGKAREVILFPHNRVANSPGNPAWDLTGGKFGPFAGQMLIGDQTQSNLLRVALQTVDGVEQGSVMPFFEGLESGVMRPLFLPDGSLLLGQTGRGWQAKGGKVASLQRVHWDGKTVAPGIVDMRATPAGFTLALTQPVPAGVTAAQLQQALSLESWTYRDAPQYGSDELDLHAEPMTGVALSADRKSIQISLATLAIKKVHPQQTARVFHARLAATDLFGADALPQLNAYYTLHRFPTAQ